MHTRKKLLMLAILPMIVLASLNTSYAATQVTTEQLGKSWAEATFAGSISDQQQQFKSTIALAEAALSSQGSDPDVLAWAGIIQASYAGTLKGLKALKHAKKARALLSAAMEYDPEALDGGARSTLGVLYYKVPPWPIGFGNKKRAETLLSESATKHPDSLNAQYFYAEYLFDQNRQSDAKRVFEQALSIPIRPDYRHVDENRFDNIERYLTQL